MSGQSYQLPSHRPVVDQAMNKITAGTAPASGLSWARRVAPVMAAASAFSLPLVSTVPAHAVTRDLHVSYVSKDGLGNIKYDARFSGTVRSNGPTGYVIDGRFDAYCSSGTLTHQSATFGYRHAPSGSWQYGRGGP
ncbi:hypothetical protein [Streptomyces sp. NPDC088760]|uniref:hypothetical protein n=1 Tax=Streptomyces sp. NPDC088760 TaxID=3365890 RepID=UPI00382A1099